MPRARRVKAQDLTSKEKEKYFLSLYVREGAVDKKIACAERRAALEPGTGYRILQRKEVQKEINARMEPVRLEQMRQQLVGDAVAQITSKLQADKDRIQRELDTLMAVPDMNVDPGLLEGSLMRLILGLEWDKHPKIMLEAIKVAAVVSGILEIKGTGWLSRRRCPPCFENGQEET